MRLMDNKRRLPFKRASFLKVLEDDIIKKLPIPPVFIKIFEGDIPSWFILEIGGTRKCWRIDIEEDANGGFYLGCGFDCFVQAQSLEVGNILLFQLDEPSILQVKIYDKDGSEKTEGTTFGSDFKIGATESLRQTPKINQERESSPCPTMPFMTLMDHKSRPPFRRASFLKILEDEIMKKMPLSPAFTTSFEGGIPSWFILEIAGTRKCWRVDIEEDANGVLYLGCGFDCFVQAQSLKVGNFLLFELEEPSILQVKIYEKDGSEKTDGMSLRSSYEVGASESPRQTQKIQEREASPWLRMPSFPYQYGAYEKPQNDSGRSKRKKSTVSPTEHGLCFSVTWKKANHFIYYLTIPRAMLVGKTFSNKETAILKDREGNSWPVELRVRADGRVDLSRGWREFVKDNDLTAGDTLTLEFVSNNLIQVHVERPFQVDNPSHGEQHCKLEPTECFNTECEKEELAANCTIYNSAPVTMDKFDRVASKSKSFSFSITYTQRTRNSYLHIPKAIANSQKLENKDIVVLCDPEGRQWLMEVKTRPSDGRVGLGRGWTDFSKSYGIRIGDTLIFEFVTDRMMKVHIVKACDRIGSC